MSARREPLCDIALPERSRTYPGRSSMYLSRELTDSSLAPRSAKGILVVGGYHTTVMPRKPRKSPVLMLCAMYVESRPFEEWSTILPCGSLAAVK